MTCTHCSYTKFKPYQDGMLCVNCGHLVLDDMEIVAPHPPKPVFMPKECCKHGHPRTPDNLTKNGSCKACRILADKKRLQNPKYKEYQKAYRGKSISGIESITFGSRA